MGLGRGLPLTLLGYGLCGVLSQRTIFGGRVSMTLRGPNAVGFGIAWISAGVFVHCHYFWGNIFDNAWFAVLGKIIAACGFIAGLAFVIVRYGIFGIG